MDSFPVQQETPEKKFLKERFREYYLKNLEPPPDITKREFGFGFEKKIDYRHKSFRSFQEFSEFVSREVPFFISYSCARYEFPSLRPMDRKGYLGSDLAFDLDRTYLEEKHEHSPVLCNYCLNRIRQDAVNLIEEFLVSDFGFSREEIQINYSGSKGFHIHLQSKPVQELSQEARKQILDYISAAGLDVEKILRREKTEEAGYILRGPTKHSEGWAKKLFDAAFKLVSSENLEDFAKDGIGKVKALKIMDNREYVLKKMEEGNWDSLKGLEGVWNKLLKKTVQLREVEVDRQVTFDVARLIRLPNSIHGDTGLIAKKIPLSEISDFDPTREAVAFDGNKMMAIVTDKEFRLEMLGQTTEIKPGKNKVPLPAGILLLCKKKALLYPE
ncbi:DNA primase catalytic subunit PriS [Candidatus Micrarchaeota archaeon]|nr:DNA primase catalytic subunit PriS [Candidatus Micrarchaeota archaeon]